MTIQVNENLFWLAGLLEGEGSFCSGPPSNPNCPFISVQMTDEDIIEKVSLIFGVKYSSSKPRKAHHKVTYRTTLKGKRAIELMKVLKPFMGIRRQSQIDNAINSNRILPMGRKPKINSEELSKIQNRLSNGEKLKDIAMSFNVSSKNIRRSITRSSMRV